MLGDIFGRIAGLTCEDELPCLFLLSLPASLDESDRLLGRMEPPGDATSPTRGLGNWKPVAVNGALAVAFGVLWAVSVGVISESFALLVSIGERTGREADLAGPGRTISSRIRSISASAAEASPLRFDPDCCLAAALDFCL